jgi:hypothetical protein
VTASQEQYRAAHRLLGRLLDAADSDSAVWQLIVMGTRADGQVIAYSAVAPGDGQVYRTVIRDFEAGMAAVAPFWADATPPEAGP